MERLKQWIYSLKIGTKLQLSIVLTVFLALVIFMAIFTWSYRGAVIESNKQLLQAKADAAANFVAASALSQEITPTGFAEDYLSPQSLGVFKPYSNTVITIFDKNNRIIGTSSDQGDFVGKDLSDFPNYADYFDRSYLVKRRDGIKSNVTRPLDGEEVFCAYSPIPTTGGIVVMDAPKKDILSSVNYFLFNLIGLTLAMFLIIILAIRFVSRRTVVRPVVSIMETFEQIGKGNYEARAEVLYDDELGRMSRSLNEMLDNTLTLIQSSEERDSMQGSIMNLLDEISGLAEGDLTARAEVSEDFTGAIAESFNEMAEQLSEVVKNVKDVTLQVIATSQDVTRSTENLAETSEMQAVQVSDAIAAINDISKSIQQVAENAVRSAGVSEQSTSHAKEGAEAVRATNRAMESIREHAQETARAIKRLGESSQEIGNIVQLINDIADRTSILALNASIQAAMAGDAGRGFAVVAEEVQRLAERSTNATKQIDTLIKNIQSEINEAGASMEESIQRVVEGSKLADGARKKLQEIETVSSQLGDLIQSISESSNQQARASEDIAKTMEEVGEISSQTSAASRQTAVAMKNLEQMSAQLNESVSVFRLADDALTSNVAV